MFWDDKPTVDSLFGAAQFVMFGDQRWSGEIDTGAHGSPVLWKGGPA